MTGAVRVLMQIHFFVFGRVVLPLLPDNNYVAGDITRMEERKTNGREVFKTLER